MWEARRCRVYCWTPMSDRSPFKSYFYHLITMQFQACHSDIYFLQSCEDWSGNLAFHSAWNTVSHHYMMGLGHQGWLPIPHTRHHLSLPSVTAWSHPSAWSHQMTSSSSVMLWQTCWLPTVFVSSCCCNKWLQTRWLKTTQGSFSYNCGGQKSEMSFSGITSRH